MKQAFPNKISIFMAASALLVLTTACAPYQGRQDYYADANMPNRHVEYALSNQGDLTVFYQALHTTGVINELHGNTEYTIFAPTNAAFTRISPRTYPCFYSVQCRPQVAAILRNHIVPRNESVDRFSREGRNLITLGNRRINVEQPYSGRYTVDGQRVLYLSGPDKASVSRGYKINLYRIDGVLASNQDMDPFRTVPYASSQPAVIEKTVTTYRKPMRRSYAPQSTMPNAYLVPGGHSIAPKE